jgi:hypothetical protein
MEALPSPPDGQIFIDFCILCTYVRQSDSNYDRALNMFARFFGRLTVPIPALANQAHIFVTVFTQAADDTRLRENLRKACERTRDLFKHLYPNAAVAADSNPNGH